MIRFVTWIFAILFTLGVVGSVCILTTLYYFGRGLPDYAQLEKYEPPVVSRVYASDGRLFAEYAMQKRVFVPIGSIPERVIKTFLAAEDKNFYIHPGLDFFGIVRAAFINLSHLGSKKRPMGASTITQQVAKNLLLSSISTQTSLERKIKEAILAFRIENALSKDRILELYLNEIYLGASSYGVAAASLNYFNKVLSELSIAEVAFLAALPKAPSKYNPKTNYGAAKARRDWVITRMYEEGVITYKEASAAKAEPITFKRRDPTHVVKADYFAEEVRRHIVAKYGENTLYQGGLAIRTTLDPQLQKIASWALRKGLIAYDRRHGWRGPFDHIDLKDEETETWQTHLSRIVPPPGISPWQVAIVLELTPKEAKIGLMSGKKGHIPLDQLTWARKTLPLLKVAKTESGSSINLGPPIQHPQDVLKKGDLVLVEEIRDHRDTYSLQQIPGVGGALVAMDPHTGRVFAMAGGFSFEASQFNRATQALRQPGSAIKPFVYLTAMERGFSPATMISDSPISIVMGRGLGVYSPKNILSRHYGVVPLRIGLQKSLNMMTIRLVHQYVGMKPVAKMIEKFGIIDHVPLQLAMTLGAGETTLLRMGTAYSMLANGGKKLEASLIDRIQDRHGNTIFSVDTRVCENCKNVPWTEQPVPSIEDTREQMADPRSIYQVTSMLEGAVRAGTGRKAQVLGKILAAKTGTTNDERDAWTFAYTPDLVVGTYVGYDNPTPLGNMEGGSRVALPIIVDFLSKALKDVPSKPFPIPPGMKLVRMREMTGQAASGGDAGVIYEALKDNQSLQGKASSSSQPPSKPKNDLPPPPPAYTSSRSYERPPSQGPSRSYGHPPSQGRRPAPLTGTGALY